MLVYRNNNHITLTCHLCLTWLHSAGVCTLFHQGHSHLLLSPQEQTGTGNCNWQQHSAVEIFQTQYKKKRERERGQGRTPVNTCILMQPVTDTVFTVSLRLISAIYCLSVGGETKMAESQTKMVGIQN